ncbi:MAG: cell division inhibitor SulA [Cellvibrionaceae bacterium]|jgi:cell division inhibitor SulA
MKAAPANYPLYPQHTDTAQKQQRITEVMVPFKHQSSRIVLPLVASLSHSSCERWTTWITQYKPCREDLIRLGANVNALLVIRLQKETDPRWLIWEALKSGSSHTVISDHQRLSRDDLSDMEKAAAVGDSYGIAVHQL